MEVTPGVKKLTSLAQVPGPHQQVKRSHMNSCCTLPLISIPIMIVIRTAKRELRRGTGHVVFVLY